MNDAETAGAARLPVPSATPSLLAPLTDPAGGGVLQRLGGFAAQEPVRRALPVFVGLAAAGAAALAWSALSPSPQRTLYAQLGDAERASVAGALDQAAIPYSIDSMTGALLVTEDDFYRARMLVASDGALAAPESGAQMLDSLPMGASRTLEGDRLRAARERDLVLTIREIDGVESVRVHLAEAERSVFVRDNAPPTASVMVRLTRGRQLSESQVRAITSLVAASVPGLAVDAVRVIDQNGRLLSDPAARADGDRLELQTRMEEKLRGQVTQLLSPMLGAGNFSSESQVELDMDEVTRAREAYDKEGAVRSETQAESQSTGPAQAAGVPGVLANTPPPPAEPEARPPQGNEAAPPGAAPVNGETRSARTYELGREVSVSNSGPGGVRRLSVAVAISKEAMRGTKPADLDQLKALVGAAVGASEARGDQVTVMVRGFEPAAEEAAAPFYEAPWFAMLVRHGAAVLAVLLVLLLGMRPLLKALRREPGTEPVADADADNESAAAGLPAASGGRIAQDDDRLGEKVDLAKRLVAERPDNAVAALRLMLGDTGGEDAGPTAEPA